MEDMALWSALWRTDHHRQLNYKTPNHGTGNTTEY